MKQIALLLCLPWVLGCQPSAPTEVVKKRTIIVMPPKTSSDCSFQDYLEALTLVSWDRTAELQLTEGRSMRVAGYTNLKIDPIVWTIDGSSFRSSGEEIGESEMYDQVRRYVDLCRQIDSPQLGFLRSTEKTTYEEGYQWLAGLIDAGVNFAIVPKPYR